MTMHRPDRGPGFARSTALASAIATALVGGLALTADSATARAGDAAIPGISIFDEPTLDRWFYPFNTTPGTRAQMSLFGETGSPLFDDRDGQVFLRWDSSTEITPGLGPETYEIFSVRITVTNATEDAVVYDDTVDAYTSYLPPEDPEFTADDPGSPLELFGAAGRNDFDPLTFPEDGPYALEDPINRDVRNIKSIAYAADGTEIDVNNNVRDRFTPAPWAVGTIDGLAPGDQVPGDAVFVFEVDLSQPGVRDYFARQLDAGSVAVLITSLQRVVQQGGDFIGVYSKESIQAQLDLVEAATLEITWQLDTGPLCPADVVENGAVDFNDLLAVLSNFGDCVDCPADIDGNGSVDFSDLLTVLSSFGPCPA
jgi:hypothetical protein